MRQKGRLRKALIDAVNMFLVSGISLVLLMYIGYGEAQGVAEDILARFDAGEFDVATIYFSAFESVISQVPTEQQIIPAEFEAEEGAGGTYFDYEPDEQEVLAQGLVCPQPMARDDVAQRRQVWCDLRHPRLPATDRRHRAFAAP